MSDELKTIKFQLMLSPKEAEAIDEWGFNHRIRTRAEAMRRLCQIGLLTDKRLEDFVASDQSFLQSNADMFGAWMQYYLSTDENRAAVLEKIKPLNANYKRSAAAKLATSRHFQAAVKAIIENIDFDAALQESDEIESVIDTVKKLRELSDSINELKKSDHKLGDQERAFLDNAQERVINIGEALAGMKKPNSESDSE